MSDADMLNAINYTALIVMLIVGFVFVWELLKGRTFPPFKIDRAKHPVWYWLCVVTHGVILAFLFLVCAALAFQIFFNNFDN
jgi:hypothetical protein